jgi:hypothetical protein
LQKRRNSQLTQMPWRVGAGGIAPAYTIC